MSLSETDVQRLDRLRVDYRATFRKWISARNLLGPAGRSEDAEEEARANEVAASLAYRNSRDHLSDAMSGTLDRDGAGVERARHLLPNAEHQLALSQNIVRREWRRDFALALVLIGIAVAGGTFLSDLSSLAR
jgi:hypothetical protein